MFLSSSPLLPLLIFNIFEGFLKAQLKLKFGARTIRFIGPFLRVNAFLSYRTVVALFKRVKESQASIL